MLQRRVASSLKQALSQHGFTPVSRMYFHRSRTMGSDEKEQAALRRLTRLKWEGKGTMEMEEIGRSLVSFFMPEIVSKRVFV